VLRQRIDDTDQRDAGQAASTRAWLLPITPAPITPTRSSLIAPVFAPDPDLLELILSTPTDFFVARLG